MLNTGETALAAEEGLATVDAGLAAIMTDAVLADEAVADAAEEEDEVTVLLVIENPPPEPPLLADTLAFTDADAADSGLPVFL